MGRRGIAKGIALLIASSILILLPFVYIPTVSANVQDETTAHAYLATATSVQGTPTVDPTLTALQKKQLILQNEQIAQQIDQQQHTLWNLIWIALTASLSAIILAIGGIWAVVRWFNDRKDARNKQTEERFKSVVDSIGGETPETRIASAVLLHTFLRPEYKEYYKQVFDLAVANLRIPEYAYSSTARSSDQSGHNPIAKTQEHSNAPSSEALHSLRQALITVFRDAFPRARDKRKKQNRMRRRFIIIMENLFRVSRVSETTRTRLADEGTRLQFKRRDLDASDIQLDRAFLFRADLRQAYMPEASLRNADFSAARLSEVILRGADLTCANFDEADLTSASLEKANLEEANFTSAELNDTVLRDANLIGANLTGAYNLTGAKLQGARYNMEKIQKKDEKEQPLKDKQGHSILIEPTQWPEGFDPNAAGATMIDGSKYL